MNTEAPRLGWVIGTENIESKKKPELKGENNGTKGGVQKHLKQDPIVHSKNSRQFEKQIRNNYNEAITSRVDTIKTIKPLIDNDISKYVDYGDMKIQEDRQAKQTPRKHTESRWHKGKHKQSNGIKSSKHVVTKLKQKLETQFLATSLKSRQKVNSLVK